MKWFVLKKISDTDSISFSVSDSNSAIVDVNFKINGANLAGQFDPDNVGVYGISVVGCELLLLLGLDADGNDITNAEPPHSESFIQQDRQPEEKYYKDEQSIDEIAAEESRVFDRNFA